MKEENLLPAEDELSLNAQILSPVLHRLKRKESRMLPKQDFACQHCPNGLWFIQNREELTCFCKMMNLVTWTTSQENVISACDGIFPPNEQS